MVGAVHCRYVLRGNPRRRRKITCSSSIPNHDLIDKCTLMFRVENNDGSMGTCFLVTCGLRGPRRFEGHLHRQDVEGVGRVPRELPSPDTSIQIWCIGTVHWSTYFERTSSRCSCETHSQHEQSPQRMEGIGKMNLFLEGISSESWSGEQGLTMNLFWKGYPVYLVAVKIEISGVAFYISILRT